MTLEIETIAIGDELLTGKISDTNSQFVGDRLFENGFRLSRSTVIPDVIEVIQQTIQEASRRADFVVCFGGLGPTSDDKTAESVALLLTGGLSTHEPSREKIAAAYVKRQRPLTAQALKQALFPTGALPLTNPTGFAVGFSCQIGRARFYFFPGVPEEMKSMVPGTLIADLQQKVNSPPMRWHAFRLLGIPESEVQGLMNAVEATLPPEEAWLGYRTQFPENHLTLYHRPVSGTSFDFEKVRDRMRELVAPWCYTETGRDLETIVLDELRARGLKLALAESCTGGMTAKRLTAIAGSSEVFWGSYVVYQNEAKAQMLGVDLPRAEEAVSASTSRRLAEKTQSASGADIVASITGYLGPSGGTPTDPIGTLYLCVLGPESTERKVVQFARTRALGQWGAATHLLNLIRETLQKRS